VTGLGVSPARQFKESLWNLETLLRSSAASVKSGDTEEAKKLLARTRNAIVQLTGKYPSVQHLIEPSVRTFNTLVEKFKESIKPSLQDRLETLDTLMSSSMKFFRTGNTEEGRKWLSMAKRTITEIQDEYPSAKPFLMPSIRKVSALLSTFERLRPEAIDPESYLGPADRLIDEAAKVMPSNEEEAKGMLKLAHSLLTAARDKVQRYARSIMTGMPFSVAEEKEIEAGKERVQKLYDRMTATGLKLLEVAGRTKTIIDEPLEGVFSLLGIRTAAKKKIGRLPRMIIETIVVKRTADQVRALFPQVERLHLVGSRLRHRYARDLEFVAVVKDERNLPGRTLVNIFGRPPDKEIAKMSPARIEALPLKIDLFFALPEEVEATILEFGLGLDNIRWKKQAIKKGLKLTRYGLFKGSKLVTRKMEEIAALIGIPLKPHLVHSLKNPL